MEESKILSMTIVVPEEMVGKNILFMTNDDRTREMRVGKMRIDGGREVKPKKFIQVKTAGEHTLEFEISTGVISHGLFICKIGEEIQVTALHIPDAVVEMEDYCFSHFNFDCEVVLPDSITKMEAFSGRQPRIKNWKNLTALRLSWIPENEETKEDIILPEGVDSLVDTELCFHTKHLHIPSTLKEIKYGNNWGEIFEHADKVTIAENHPCLKFVNDCLVDFKEGILLHIGKNTEAFPEGIKSINCDSSSFGSGIIPPALDVKRLVLPEGLKATCSFPFWNMTKLEEIVFPSTLTLIGYMDLRGIQVSKITIPASVTAINVGMLMPYRKGDKTICSKVKEVVFEGDISNFNLDKIFEDCPKGLTAYQNGHVVWTNDESVKVYDPDTELDFELFISEDGKTLSGCKGTAESIVIPNGVKEIAEGAFKGKISIKKVTLPDSLKTIGESAFEQCSSLEEVTGGAKISKICDNAFEGTALRKIVLPDTLKDIRYSVFQDCKNLSEVTLGKAVKRIWESAFDGCPITSIQLPDTVQQIDEQAFQGAHFEEIKLPASLKKCISAFQNSKLKRAVVPEGIQEIDFRDCRELESISMSEDMAKIPNYFLSGCEKITEIHIPVSVTEIGGSAYNGTAIKQVTLPEGLKSIYIRAFQKTNLEEVVFPDNLEDLHGEAFSDCKFLKRVVFGNNISFVGDNVFRGCDALEEVVIPDGCNVNIQPAAFSRCKNLKRIITPEGKESKFKEQILKTAQTAMVCG